MALLIWERIQASDTFDTSHSRLGLLHSLSCKSTTVLPGKLFTCRSLGLIKIRSRFFKCLVLRLDFTILFASRLTVMLHVAVLAAAK